MPLLAECLSSEESFSMLYVPDPALGFDSHPITIQIQTLNWFDDTVGISLFVDPVLYKRKIFSTLFPASVLSKIFQHHGYTLLLFVKFIVIKCYY